MQGLPTAACKRCNPADPTQVQDGQIINNIGSTSAGHTEAGEERYYCTALDSRLNQRADDVWFGGFQDPSFR